MATDDRFQLLEETRRNMEENYRTSKTKIQPVPTYMLEPEKHGKYYSPKLISFGPIHHGELKLKKGEQYKLMWASMYAEASSQTTQLLHKRVVDNISELRELFKWDEIGRSHDHHNDDDLAWMLFVDGCSVLQILEKADLSNPQGLKVKLDILDVVERDLFLLENQLPYKLLKLLSGDEMKLKKRMVEFCELQNMFKVSQSPISPFGRDSDLSIQILMQRPAPTHLLHFLRSCILGEEFPTDAFTLDEGFATDLLREIDIKDGHQDKVMRMARQFKAAWEVIKPSNLLDIVYTYANRDTNKKYTSYRNIQELKGAAIQVKRQKNISLISISFSSSVFGGKLYLPPLILNDSTVSTLLNLVAYEMCSDFINEFEISSYVKLLNLLIDNPEDVKELRSSGILRNSLGSDEEVVELFKSISSSLVHNPSLYSGIQDQVESHYKNKLSIWMADVYYTYFRSPGTIITFLAALIALIALVLTALQTWKAF